MADKYKIECNGRFTRVFGPQGVEIRNVRTIHFEQHLMSPPRVTLELVDVAAVIEGDWQIVRETQTTRELERIYKPAEKASTE